MDFGSERRRRLWRRALGRASHVNSTSTKIALRRRRGAWPGGQTAALASKWLQRVKDGQGFLLCHVYEPLGPYEPPERTANRSTASCFIAGALQVPLLLKLQGAQRAGTNVAAPVQLIDVVPTAADLLAIPTPPSKIFGTSPARESSWSEKSHSTPRGSTRPATMPTSRSRAHLRHPGGHALRDPLGSDRGGDKP